MKDIIFEGSAGELRLERRKGRLPRTEDCHFHGYYELYYLVSGKRQYFIQDKSCCIQAGDFVLIDINQIHKEVLSSEEPSVSCERVVIQISEVLFKQFRDVFQDINFVKFFADHAGIYRMKKSDQEYAEKLMYEIEQELSRNQSGSSGIACLKLMEMLTLIVRNENAKVSEELVPIDAKGQKIQEVAHLLSEHYNAQISLEEIASSVYVNKYYLCHIFKEVTGMTLREYHNLCRIRQAQKLLRESSYSVTEISEEIGYDSVNYFGKVFKIYMGVTPLQYRRLAIS